MGIARPPANSPKKVIVSSEGRNIDQWQSININKFVPEALQQILDAINEILDVITSIIEFAIAIAKLIAALVSELFSLVKAIIEALRDEILALLDLIPKLEAGIYLLWIPTEFGGVDYYTNTFRNSLSDRLDLRRPPSEDYIPFKAMIFMWGYPWWDNAKRKAFGEVAGSFKRIFSLDSVFTDRYEVPTPDDFSAEKGYFAKPKDTAEEKSLQIKVPENVTVDGTLDLIRTTTKVVSRKSDIPGVAVNINWNIPEGFNAFTLTKEEYVYNFQENDDFTETHKFTKFVSKIIGIDIIRTENLKDMADAKEKLRDQTINVHSLSGTAIYGNGEGTFVPDTTSYIIHKDLNIIPGTDFHIDYPPDADEKDYYYAAAFVFTFAFSEVWATKKPKVKEYTIDRIYNSDLANPNPLPTPDSNNLDEVDFSNIDPRDVRYGDTPFNDNFTDVATATAARLVNRTTAPAASGVAPDWIAFRALEDLLPEIKRFLDKARNLVNNIIDDILDDLNAFEEWLQEWIQSIEDKLKEAQDLVDLLRSLLFPPMLGLHYLGINTKFGMPKVLERYEQSLTLGLKTEDGAYNPLLLDQGFRQEHPDEFARRVDIPAYDKNHKVGGFILAFQEPAVGAFLQGLWGLGDNFTDTFQKIVNDDRLGLNDVVFPQLKKKEPPTHPFVEVFTPGRATIPSNYMDDRSKWKSGTDLDDPFVNDDGNVEVKSAPGPYTNDGPPTTLSVRCSGGSYHQAIIPSGEVTASQVVGLLGDCAKLVDDNSFVIEGTDVGISRCSAGAATMFGLTPGTSIKAPDQDPELDGEEFEVSEGDLLVELTNNGKSTLEMKQGSYPIFQLNEFNEAFLGPNAHLIKINVEGEEHIIDVTGNSGTNPINKSPTWEYTATFPFVVQEPNPSESIVGNDQFTFQITGAPVEEGIISTPTTITIPPLTYNTVHSLSAMILRSLDTAGYPLGLFSTNPNGAEDGASLFVVDEWGHNSGVVITITPETRDFVSSLDTSVVNPGTDKIPYLVDDVVANLNAPYLKDYFSNEEGKIRITGQNVGTWNSIKVFSALTNPEYALVARTIFGMEETPALDMEVFGLGVPMTVHEYWIEIQETELCVDSADPVDLNNNSLIVEIQNPDLIVETQNDINREYIIEFVE